jgi:hypothetical protein
MDPLKRVIDDVIILIEDIIIMYNIYATFLPQALQPGLALCTRCTIGAFNAIFLLTDGRLATDAK